MKKLMYCVRDDVAEVFQPPFCSINDATAKRDFIDGVSQNNRIKNDLTLYAIAEYNDNSGIITAFPTPKRLMSGFEVNAPDAEYEGPVLTKEKVNEAFTSKSNS